LGFGKSAAAFAVAKGGGRWSDAPHEPGGSSAGPRKGGLKHFFDMQFYCVVQKPSGDETVEQFRTDFYFDDSDAKGDAEKCPDCGEFISMLPSLPPYHVHLETWGEDFGDLAFWMSEFLVSRRFRESYRGSGLKGLPAFEPSFPEAFRQKPRQTPQAARVFPGASEDWSSEN
jgi:hypothetical protein